MVSKYFAQRRDDPEHGTIEIAGERYVLVRAASLSVEFFTLVRELYGPGRSGEADDFSRNLLFDLAHAIGKSDARCFHSLMQLKDPIEKLTAGPVHFSHSGWAFVDILPESEPHPDDRYRLIYDHPYSFESTAWIEAGHRPAFPVCIMNAGYSSGWCEESFGLPLVASEVLCRARGDEACRFVMGHPERMEALLEQYVQARPRSTGYATGYPIPDFFSRKRMEEELRQARDDLEVRVQERTVELSRANEQLRTEIVSRQRAEKQVLQTAKLEAIGRLAGGIAHDFNNLMSVVIGMTSSLEQRVGDNDPIRAQLSEIRKAGEHAASLTRQLLTFSKSRVPHAETVDVNAVVEEVVRMLGRLLGEDVELSLALSSEDCWALVDRGHLTQVIMNLALNARDAMPDGGRLTITTRSVTVVETNPPAELEVGPGEWSIIEVEDDGVGMSEAVLARAFEPFFTTKAGSGTGLGLSTVYGILTGAGGSVAVSSKPNEGALFRVFLPRAHPSDRPQPSASPDPLELAGPDSPVILVVDDTTALRNLVSGLLTGLGYRVVSARDGDEALDLFAEWHEQIGLLLTDVVMPKMNGRELAAHLQQQAPGLAVLYMTGYTDDEVLRYGVQQGECKLIYKPFTPHELAAAVSEALARRTEPTGRD